MSNFINFDEGQKIAYEQLPWTKISDKVKTKSKDDCRNRWFLQIHNCIFEKVKFSDLEEKRLFEKIKEQSPESEFDIDFGLIKNGKSENENRWKWNRMKRLVYGRQSFSFEELIQKLGAYFEDGGIKGGEKEDFEDLELKKVQMNMNGLMELFRGHYSA